MTLEGKVSSRVKIVAGPRVGIFGNLGMRNIGNDASMEAMLNYLSSTFPGVMVEVMGLGPDVIRAKYGMPAVWMSWYLKSSHDSRASKVIKRALGMGIDVFRTAAWVRRQDVVLVAGAGVLESSLPINSWGFPYSFFLVSAFGRIFQTKVGLVSVGAGPIKRPMTRWLGNGAAKLAYYRSYRDAGSKKTMQRRGVDSSGDAVYADLVFSLPVPAVDRVDSRTVCVGVMDYYGSNDDRKNAMEIHRSYVAEMILFIEWLIDNDRRVLLVIGDANGSDDSVAQEILVKVQNSRPTMDPSCLVVYPSTTLEDILEGMRTASSVVAIRFHNIVAALMLGKPTMVISYSGKHDALAAEVELEEYCHPARAMDHKQMIRQFTELEERAPELSEALAGYKAKTEKLLDEQFAELSASLFASWL